MTVLRTDPNMAAPDDFYEALLVMHHGLTEAQSQLVNARLILLFANHIGEPEVLSAAMDMARAGVVKP